MCSPAPVASKAWDDARRKWGGISFLGIVGDQSHQSRVSGHNCGGGQESGLTHPDNGRWYNYPDSFAHALDIGHGGNRSLAAEMRNAFLNDPRKRVRYVIDNGVVYNPGWRGGGTSSADGHETHIHVSFTPWATFDVNQFFGPPPEPAFPIEPGDHGFHVLILEILLVHNNYPNVVVDGLWGAQSVAAASDLKQFLKRGRDGSRITEADYEAIVNWTNFIGEGPIRTLSDRGPKVRELRRDLGKIGQDVGPGRVYGPKVQKAVQNVQRFFDLKHKAGNATPEDRAFIRDLAERA